MPQPFKSGNVQPQLDKSEHNQLASAKNVTPRFLLAGGSNYIVPSVFDYVTSDPVAVVLVDTSGDPYVAAGGGGVAMSVTSYIATDPVNVVGTVTAHIGDEPLSVVGTVTAHIGDEPLDVTITGQPIDVDPGVVSVIGTVTAHIGDEPLTVDGTVNIGNNIAGTVTANIGNLIAGTVTANIGNNIAGTVTANIALNTIAPASTQLFTAIGVSDGTPTVVLAARSTRRSFAIDHHRGDLTINVYLGPTAVLDDAAGKGLELEPGETWAESGHGILTDVIHARAFTGTVTLYVWDRWEP
jgi:hypothetical protein